jgi:hypothetical protein
LREPRKINRRQPLTGGANFGRRHVDEAMFDLAGGMAQQIGPLSRYR